MDRVRQSLNITTKERLLKQRLHKACVDHDEDHTSFVLDPNFDKYIGDIFANAEGDVIEIEPAPPKMADVQPKVQEEPHTVGEIEP